MAKMKRLSDKTLSPKKKAKSKKSRRFVRQKDTPGSGSFERDEYVGEVCAVFWSDGVVLFVGNP